MVHVARAGARHQPVRAGARCDRAGRCSSTRTSARTSTRSPASRLRPIADECLTLCPSVQPLLDQLEPFPACVLNARLDLLAFNNAYASFFDDLEEIPIEDRNVLWLTFTDPRWRDVIVDWDETAGLMVAEFRAAMAEHLDEPAWKTLVARLQHASPEFGAFWERHDVQAVESRTKRAMHPTLGLLSLDYTNLWLGLPLGTRIVAFTPADDRTRKRLERLHEAEEPRDARERAEGVGDPQEAPGLGVVAGRLRTRQATSSVS